MIAIFYIAAMVAIASTALAITRTDAVHALLYFVTSLLAVALVFYLLGAPFVAALEVIVYAGAIVVLFVFVVMVLNFGPAARLVERRWMTSSSWRGPAALALILLVELGYCMSHLSHRPTGTEVAPRAVALSLFGPYLLGVELASMLLLAALVGAYHLGRGASEKSGSS